MSNKLHDDRLARETQTQAASAQAEQQRRERRKSQVKRLAREAIRRTAGDRAERLEKLDARIDEEDIDSDIDRIADSAIIARLCKDCGVAVPWDLWAGEHWAQEEIRRKPPGSAYAGWPPEAPPETGPVEAEPPPPEPLQPQAEVSAASVPEPVKPEPDDPYVARMKARLAMALHSGAWMQVLQTDPMLAGYVQSRLYNSS